MESAQLSLFDRFEVSKTTDKGFVNQLICGDNLTALQPITQESIDLVYIDPPFNSNANYFYTDKKGGRTKAFTDIFHWDEASQVHFDRFAKEYPKLGIVIGFALAMKDLRLAAYLLFMAPRLLEIHRILKSNGFFFLHCDSSASHYLVVLLDCIFGYTLQLPPFVWKRTSSHNDTKRFGRVHDEILWYGKADLSSVQMPDDFCLTNFPPCNSQSKQKTGYPTQKPILLLAFLITLSSKPDDIVLDCFCGSGTTLYAAQQAGRNWIGIDLSDLAISIARDRIQTGFPYASFTTTRLN